MIDPQPEALPLVQTRQVGEIRIHAIEAGTIRLDGGAMFGVVPKALWERRIPADENNPIPIALRCLLFEAPDDRVLVDTGVGAKEVEKFRQIFFLENEGNPTRLEDGIRAAGFSPEEIDIALLTHLHFDHAGGGTVLRDDGEFVPAFPRARYVVQRGEFGEATHPNERNRSSYLARNLDAITAAGLWDFVEGEPILTRGIRLLRTPGHAPHHQSPLVESESGEKAIFLGDLCPTAAHIPLPWVAGYDVDPILTMEVKRGLWGRAREEDWLLIFQHDHRIPWGYLAPDAKGLSDRE
jgi:glyoxylase-like metal-dependent hydrolase (beta-lactamase superfamily II)